MSLRHPSHIGCAILAAGRSERLGAPKQLIRLQGVPLVRRTAEVALASNFAATALITGHQAEAVKAAVADLPLHQLENPNWQEGIAASIRTAVAWAEKQGYSHLALTTCDQWRLSQAHLQNLIAAVSSPTDLAGSEYANTLGIPAIFGSHWYNQLDTLTGDRGAGRIPWPEGLDDLDTEADLKKAQADRTH